MAGTSVLKLKVDDNEYDAGLRRAQSGLQALEKSLHEAGKSFSDVDKQVVEYVRAIGKMDTTAKSSRGALRDMTQTLTDLTLQYRALTDEERKSPFGEALSQSLAELTQRASDINDAMGDVSQSISNAASDTRTFDQVAGGFTFMVSGLQTAQGAAKLLGIEFGNDLEIVAKLQAAMAVTSGLQQIQTMLQKQSALMQGIIALQTRFNFLAKMNPYALLATAAAAVVGAYALFSDSADDARRAQEQLSKEIENTKFQIQELGNNADFDARIAEAAGASWEEIHRIRLEAAKLQEELAYQAWKNVPLGSEFKEQRDQALAEWDKASASYNKILEEGLINEVAKRNHTGRYAKHTSGGGGSSNTVAAPAGSMAALNEEIKSLQQQQSLVTNTNDWKNYAEQIYEVQIRVKELKGELGFDAMRGTQGISILSLGSAQAVAQQDAFRKQKLNVKTVTPNEKTEVKLTEQMGQMVGGINSMVSGIESLGIELPKGLHDVLGGIQSVISIMSGISSILVAIEAISTADTIIPFHTGGAVRAARGYRVPGNYGYDAVPAILTSGETVLTRAQTGNLASQLAERNSGMVMQPYVDGEKIFLGMNNTSKRMGRGEIVTTSMLRQYGLLN